MRESDLDRKKGCIRSVENAYFQEGGLVAYVKDGDEIKINVKSKKIELLISNKKISKALEIYAK